MVQARTAELIERPVGGSKRDSIILPQARCDVVGFELLGTVLAGIANNDRLRCAAERGDRVFDGDLG